LTISRTVTWLWDYGSFRYRQTTTPLPPRLRTCPPSAPDVEDYSKYLSLGAYSAQFAGQLAPPKPVAVVTEVLVAPLLDEAPVPVPAPEVAVVEAVIVAPVAAE
jgi:hypothetical protein